MVKTGQKVNKVEGRKGEFQVSDPSHRNRAALVAFESVIFTV